MMATDAGAFFWQTIGAEACPECGGDRERRQLYRHAQPDDQAIGVGVLLDCPCRKRATQAQERAREESMRRGQASILTAKAMELSEIGSHFRDRTFANYIVVDGNREGYELAERCAQRITARAVSRRSGSFPVGAKGCGLYGPMEVGKSHLAASIVNACIEAGVWGVFATSATIVDNTIGDRTGEQRRRYGNAPLLVIDDLGREPSNITSVRKLLDIVNLRRENRLPVVVTTNRTPNELLAQYQPLGDDIAAILVRLRELTEWPWASITQRFDRGAS